MLSSRILVVREFGRCQTLWLLCRLWRPDLALELVDQMLREKLTAVSAITRFFPLLRKRA